MCPLPANRYDWPDGARIAVALNVALEWWNPTYPGPHVIPAIPAEQLREGVDMLGESAHSYGGSVGLPRLTALLDQYGVAATAACNGCMVERYPEEIKQFLSGAVEREICAHSWSQDLESYKLSRTDLGDNVDRCVEVIKQVTGQTPVGWISPNGRSSTETAAVLAERGFLYHGDYADSDSAGLLPIDGRGQIVTLPVSWAVNDVGQFVRARNAPSFYVEIFRRQFDVLYREGGQVAGAVAHASVFGRPFGASAVEEIIQYAQDHKQVWFATGQQIAQVVAAQK